MLEGRFAAVQADLAVRSKPGSWHKPRRPRPTPANAPSPAAPQFRAPELPKNVQPFRSSDGFLLLRGRDAKGTPSFTSWQPRTISGCIPAVGRARTS